MPAAPLVRSSCRCTGVLTRNLYTSGHLPAHLHARHRRECRRFVPCSRPLLCPACRRSRLRPTCPPLPRTVLFFVTGRTDSEGSSNGNAEREQQAIRALGRSKMPSGLAGSLRSHGHGDHLDMLEALAGDLRVGESTVVAHDPRPALVCRCSSTSCRSDSDDVVERRPSAVAAKASSLSSSDIVRRSSLQGPLAAAHADVAARPPRPSQELAPVNALSYQAPPSASSSIDSGLPTPPSPRTPSSGPLPRP